MLDMAWFANTLRRLMKYHDPPVSQCDLAKALGVSRTSVQRWLKDGFPDDERIDALADFFQLTEAERRDLKERLVKEKGGKVATSLIAEFKRIAAQSKGDNVRPLSMEGCVTVPIYDIEAGNELAFDDGGLPVGVADSYAAVPTLTDKKAFGCIIRGDSMEPLFHEGEIVVFSPSTPPQDGDYCFIKTDELSTFKQVFFDRDEVRLVALNRQYEEMRIKTESVLHLYPLSAAIRAYESGKM